LGLGDFPTDVSLNSCDHLLYELNILPEFLVMGRGFGGQSFVDHLNALLAPFRKARNMARLQIWRCLRCHLARVPLPVFDVICFERPGRALRGGQVGFIRLCFCTRFWRTLCHASSSWTATPRFFFNAYCELPRVFCGPLIGGNRTETIVAGDPRDPIRALLRITGKVFCQRGRPDKIT
jgi:hypothetical protein